MWYAIRHMIMFKILKYKVSCFNADYAVTGQREGLLLLCFMSFFMSLAETHCAFCCFSCWKVSTFQFSFLKCYGTLFTPWFLAYFFQVLSAISKGVQAHSIFLRFSHSCYIVDSCSPNLEILHNWVDWSYRRMRLIPTF